MVGGRRRRHDRPHPHRSSGRRYADDALTIWNKRRWASETGLILVTGATGLLGNNVARLLVERGRPVRVLLREDSDPRPLAKLKIDNTPGDIRDATSVRRACEGVWGVVHAAAFVRIGWRNAQFAVVHSWRRADGSMSATSAMWRLVSWRRSIAWPASESRPDDSFLPGRA